MSPSLPVESRTGMWQVPWLASWECSDVTGLIITAPAPPGPGHAMLLAGRRSYAYLFLQSRYSSVPPAARPGVGTRETVRTFASNVPHASAVSGFSIVAALHLAVYIGGSSHEQRKQTFRAPS